MKKHIEFNTARFWEFINGSHVKITLKPGQTLHHCKSGPTDEGWFSDSTSWRLSSNGRMLRREFYSDGADCDGRLSSGHDSVALPDPREYVPLYSAPDLMRPDWRDAGGWQRDYQAEAAGY